MSRRNKILIATGLSLVGLALVVVVSAILVLRSVWFHDYVREKIVAVTEESTGGKVELGAFDFDWTHLRASLRNFVLHGTEPAGQAPLFRADLIQVDLKLLSGFRKMVDLSALLVERPQANVIVYPDGKTNVPEPKVKTKSDGSGLATVVDLAVGRFDVTNGGLAFNAQKASFSAKGENLRAQLGYDALKPSYRGAISMAPLFLQSGKNAALNLNVNVPLTIEKDAIRFNGARISTAASQIDISGAVERMSAPRTSAQVNARVGFEDIRKLVEVPLQTGGGLPSEVTADAAVVMDDNGLQISSAHVRLGESTLEASGGSNVSFKTSLALGQLGRMLKVAQQPEGVLEANGTAKVSADYQVEAKLRGSNLGFRNGEQRLGGIGLSGDLSANPKRIDLKGFQLAAFGGGVTGNASVEDLKTFQFAGNLHDFNTRVLARTFAQQDLPYEGVISGAVKAGGTFQAPAVEAHLAIAPGSRGVPVSGKINADFNGGTNVIRVADSFVALPNTRLDLSGSLDRELQFKLVSSDLNDLQPAVGKPLPVALKNGQVSCTGSVSGKLDDPKITAVIQATNFTLQDRPFDRFSADVSASQSGAQVQNGSLTHASAALRFSGSVGLRKWQPENSGPLQVDATIANANVADLLAQATGTLNATARIGGTIGSPSGNANLTVVNGTAGGERFDRLATNVDFSEQLVKLTNTELTAGVARIDANATFQHAKDSFNTGNVQFHVVSNRMPIDQFNAVKQQAKGVTGMVQLNADGAATVREVKGQTEVLLTSVNANASANGLQQAGRKLGDLTASAQTSGSTVNFNVNSDFAGSTVRVNGQTQLQSDYPTSATASIANLPIEQVLAVLDRKDIAAKGNFNADAKFSGTIDNPQASATIDLTKAVLSDEPLDRVQGAITYNNQLVTFSNLQVSQGPARIDASGTFQHPKGDFEQGKVQFQIASNQIQLGQLHIVRVQKPGLTGTLQLNASGTGELQKLPKGSTAPPILFSALNANVGAKGIEMDKKGLGDLTLKADTRGSDVVFTLDSDIGKSNIHGQGQTRLGGDYATTAQIAFSNVTYGALLPLIGTTGPAPSFDALAEGGLTLSGPAIKPDQMAGTLTVAKLEVTSKRTTAKKLSLQNAGPIVMAMKNQVVTVQSAHMTGPSTDINVTGSVALNDTQAPLNLQVNAKTDLKILEDFDRDIYSAGSVDVQAAVRGTFNQPLVNGLMHLQNASFNMVDLPNGISNANGTIQFNGTNAVIQNLTAETGGGKVTAGGAVGFANGIARYGLRANAANVRVRTPEGASVVVGAAVNLTGTGEHSLLSGTVTVNKIGFNPKSDLGSLLAKSAPPTQTPESPSGLLAGMKLDVRIRTAPDVAVQTALAQGIQADADLTLRGTLATPGMLGRINVTSGKLIFFGTTYDVNDGSVSFFNPLAIEPVLDVDLETKAQGVDVILSVSGPANNLKLNYRSDPPLQFTEIVGLLAAGTTPTSDPTILANQPAPAQQSISQMGESALVSQAIAGPLSSRLERVFGVNKLKIDPAFTSGSSLPQARLTFQQQVARDITFTYITDVTQANSQIIKVEWSISPVWSAVATRDQFGRFGVDFFYKRQIR